MRVRLRFRLSSLFVTLTVALVVFGWYTDRYLGQAAAMREIASAAEGYFRFSDGSVADTNDVVAGRCSLFAKVTTAKLARGTMESVLASLSGLPFLQRLSLGHVELTDAQCREIGELTNLQYLELRNTGISDAGLAMLSGLKDLQYLGLRNTDVTGIGFASFGGFTQLRHIDLYGTPTDDRGLRELTRFPVLEQLDVEFTDVTDDGLGELAMCPQLKRVVVGSLAISEAAVDILRQSVSEVDVFITRDAPVWSPDPSELGLGSDNDSPFE